MPKLYGYTEILGDVLITGSFSILGSASTINSTNLTVEDSIIVLAHGQTGSPVLDTGIFFVRGTGATQAFIWDESVDEFALVQTSDDHTVIGNVNITGYSNLRLGNIGIGGAPSANTTAYIKGSGTSSGAYSLKIDDGGGNPLLYVRNDGNATLVDATIGRGNGQILGNIAFGINSLFNNLTGYNNTAVGYYTLSSNTSGQDNTAFGTNALRTNSTGYENVAIGSALVYNTTGVYNVAVGSGSLLSNTTGSSNISVGKLALGSNTTASNNVGIGYRSLHDNTVGAVNVAIGGDAALFSQQGSGSIGLGSYAGQQSNGNNNIFIGTYAGAYLTASSNRLFIDNSNGRANVAGDEENGLITGLFSSSANSQYLRLNANVGVGITASSRLHIKGIDNTSSNYALKVESASASSLFNVRNDGTILINNPTPTGLLSIKGKNNDGSTYPLYIENTSPLAIYRINDVGNVNQNGTSILNAGGSITTSVIDLYAASGNYTLGLTTTPYNGVTTTAGNVLFRANKGNLGSSSFGNIVFVNEPNDAVPFIFNVATGIAGFGTTSPTARLHVVGSGTYSLKIDDGVGNPLLYVRNDGNVGIGTTSSSYPLHVSGTVSSDAGYNIGATAGFTGTGTYTNFTIIGGIIVSAS